ncbi:SRPBCC family protein [Leifsonia sp. fls2-241-R2A-40a]|uniref:SRPBCC family protein n=1 Tax=Leifsonia sp. fls2-241-R2A-40a TaxID=3040290 RepID=UPI00254E4327|nr:SRPBCC family protein [Leifsonia sp. fls2-241-R2A-40a]
MDDRIVRALIGSREQPEIVLRREYDATPEEVRDACTSLPRLARWLGTVGGAPAGVGDAFTVDLGSGASAAGRVLHCDRSSVAVSWAADSEPGSILEARRTPEGPGRTALELRHRIARPETVAADGFAWEHLVDSLAHSVEGVNPPAPNRSTWERLALRPLDLSRTIAADRSRVWDALSTAEGLRSWWWRHWPDVTIQADVRPGGGYRIVAPAAGIVLEGTYLAVEPRERLAFTWVWRDEDGSSRDEAVEMRLTGDGHQTGLNVRHTGPWADDAPAESYLQGWRFTLGELDAVVASAP